MPDPLWGTLWFPRVKAAERRAGPGGGAAGRRVKSGDASDVTSHYTIAQVMENRIQSSWKAAELQTSARSGSCAWRSLIRVKSGGAADLGTPT